jgi:transcriptional regulator with GAF, ATPase, and Fis domain
MVRRSSSRNRHHRAAIFSCNIEAKQLYFAEVENDPALSLALWRTVGAQSDLQSGLRAAIELLGSRLPVSVAAIRLLTPEHRIWETVALAGSGPTQGYGGVDHIAEGKAVGLPSTLHREPVLRVDPAAFGRVAPGLLPHAVAEPVVTAVICKEPQLIAVLLLAGVPGQALSAAVRGQVEALVEPLGPALRHYVSQRDTAALREAAEADRMSLLGRLGRRDIAEVIVGTDSGLRDVMERVAQVARSDAPVLLLGETGSGKEVVARAIHRQSPRAERSFIRVNCGAIPNELIDSELFGHERGSFTGAVTQRRGWFERASGGTLFLDEVAELPLPAQVRLLRVMQDGLVQRVGGEQSITADVRIVAATHQDLRTMIRAGLFREDLWYRLAVFPIELPALRERVADVPALAAHFAQRAAGKLGLAPCLPCDEDIRMLCRYDWPGNIRELSSVIERAAILGNGRRLEVAKALGIEAPVTSSLRPMPALTAVSTAPRATDILPGPMASTTFDDQARAIIEAALRRSLGRVDGPFGAALQLRLNPQTLRSRMKKLGIDARGFRAHR